MKEVKVRELQGAALDWAVAQVEGLDWQLERGCYGSGYHVVVLLPEPAHKRYGVFRPSTDWSQAGPLIEKYGIYHSPIDCTPIGMHGFRGLIKGSLTVFEFGETHLIAACRAIVAAKLGDVVSIPDELVEG